MSSQAGISSGRAVSSASGGITPSSFWRANVCSRRASQPWSNLPLYFADHSGAHVMRRVGRPGREVDEERLVRHQRLLLADPLDRPVGHVLGEVVALLRGLVGLDRRRPLVDRGVVLVGLAADEAVEVLEAAAAARPRVERAERARLPHRHLVTLAELRRRVAVELQRLRQRRARVRADRVVARRRGRDLGDPAHPDRVVVAARQQRRARRRAERRRVEAAELQPFPGQALRRRRLARATERTRAPEAGIVDQHDQDIRRARRRAQRLDRRELRSGILGVLVDRPSYTVGRGSGGLRDRCCLGSGTAMTSHPVDAGMVVSRRVTTHHPAGVSKLSHARAFFDQRPSSPRSVTACSAAVSASTRATVGCRHRNIGSSPRPREQRRVGGPMRSPGLGVFRPADCSTADRKRTRATLARTGFRRALSP